MIRQEIEHRTTEIMKLDLIFAAKPSPFPNLHPFQPARLYFRHPPRSLNAPTGGENDGNRDEKIRTVEIRFRRGARKREKQQEDPISLPPPPPPPKEWESMSFAEKAIEVYMGEKGLLFWLNKFAYASIFIIIGGWILFRFVGPSLGFYELEGAPLSPSDVLKGS